MNSKRKNNEENKTETQSPVEHNQIYQHRHSGSPRKRGEKQKKYLKKIVPKNSQICWKTVVFIFKSQKTSSILPTLKTTCGAGVSFEKDQESLRCPTIIKRSYLFTKGSQ